MRREEVKDGESPYLFLPLPVQVEMDESTVKHLLIAGARGVAKSYGSRWHLYKRCAKIPGYTALLLRCTYDELNKNHLQFMAAESQQIGATYKGGNVREMSFPNSSTIFAGYCDDQSDVKRHVGNEWDEVVFEEAVHFLPLAINEISVSARGSKTARPAKEALGITGGRTRLQSNPGGRAMLYLQDFYISKTPDQEEYPTYQAAHYGFISSTLDDNPYLAEDYEETTLSHLTAARYKQWRHGDWSVYAGAFFGAFDSQKHLQQLDMA